ncbi:FAD-binding monooxygenase [Aurantimonas sp. MSK8Z-1]|uniref:FAD-binding monooxygenase n=1 Tax=Mangrovibrevibacter kandeliae TaxID=2968473 RepID=UPI00211999DB|nr:FAD-binding monooxygenase [Aurantimonas sp. MSK8Z-1]MCW4115760.1 FAD-binding monooxygenase [Aurantimonas sp. MSK8Z-1]
MQFHLNGFRTGSPEIAEAAGAPRSDALPDEVDVLIVGCGPAGLTLAAQLAAFPDITTRIVEQKPGPLELGQADGIACRTMEMFEAFGFTDRVLKEAYWVNETSFWKPDETERGRIVRAGRVQDTEDGLSEFPHVILNQARVHDFLLDVMRNAPTRLEPDYARRLLDLEIDAGPASAASHPVTVRLERTDDAHAGVVETVRARYVVGCDGARSAVRRSIGRALHGEAANQAWGVMDVLAVTDFPDVRLKAAVQSANEGNLLIIPREGGYLIRIYVEMDKLAEDERVASKNLTVEHLIAAAQRILQPYTLEVKEVAWWSAYEIGQRLCDKFDDVPEGDTERMPHVFIAGDACHTHSPKAGQGMNVSMRDSFNLGWKLAAVLRAQAGEHLLHTYSGERHAVAQELIDFDREWAKMFSAPPKSSGETSGDGVDPAEFQRYFVQKGRFTAGTATQYQPSLITGGRDWQALATGFPLGMRFHSAPVIRLADAKPVELGHAVKADGRWRLFAFAPAAREGGSEAIATLCRFLSTASDSPIQRYTPKTADIDSVIDVRAVFQEGHQALDLEAMPPLLLPQKGRYGLRDYEKIFCADLKSGRDVFEMRAIDRQRGCLVVVRPDQHVAHVLPLDELDALAAFFAGFMRDAG